MTAAERAARRAILPLLERIAQGELTVAQEDGERLVFGAGAPRAVIEVRRPRAWVRMLRGSRGLAEGYVAGDWETPDLPAVIRIAARNAYGLDELRRRLSALRVPWQQARSLVARNTPGRSRRDIAAHYDLGNDLFELMLDPTMTYSCGVFERPGATLEEASTAKLELVCRKLALRPEDHVLEIGTGWGSFALHAAATRGCRVTTTTISAEQRALADERVRAAGLEDRVAVVSSDYRELQGTYDKLVSIEMIEAVGWRDFGTFFAACSDRLHAHGAMLLQAIVIDDRAYEVEKASKSFIRTYVFPHGCLPSHEVIARCVARRTDLRTVHLEDLTPHYVQTLRHWRENLEAAADRLAARGYDERFRRLWRMYLAYCEGGFAERRIGVVQTLLAKPGWAGALGDVPRALPDLRSAASG
jgi:cyclopropane-fatty-acyl-phospholipid synthase